jgi:hypothetical protein
MATSREIKRKTRKIKGAIKKQFPASSAIKKAFQNRFSS